ncbi:hypothetical protein INR49_016017, partial [Caranx melampygus]
MQKNSSVTDFEQMQESWTTLLNRIYEDPKVTRVMETRVGRYLSSHPVLALTVMLFAVMAALPVGLFLVFALVTIVMSAVGFVFFEVFLLFVGGLTLLCVLSGLAFFSVIVSFIFNIFYGTIFNIFNYYDPRLTKQRKVQEKESECESSTVKEVHREPTFGDIKVEEVTVEDSLDHTGHDSNHVKEAFEVETPDPVEEIEGSIHAQTEQVMGGDSLRLASLADHEELWQDCHRLQEREVMVDEDGQTSNRNYQELHSEAVMVAIIGGPEFGVDQ